LSVVRGAFKYEISLIDAVKSDRQDRSGQPALIEEMALDAIQVAAGEPDQSDPDRLLHKYPPN
jgi:hypothetical protein